MTAPTVAAELFITPRLENTGSSCQCTTVSMVDNSFQLCSSRPRDWSILQRRLLCTTHHTIYHSATCNTKLIHRPIHNNKLSKQNAFACIMPLASQFNAERFKHVFIVQHCLHLGNSLLYFHNQQKFNIKTLTDQQQSDCY